MTNKINKKCDFKEIEEKWKKYWEERGIYKADLNNKDTYSIDTPPPTVSGKMHIGHAFSYSQQDFIARFRRMYHGSVFFPFGTDDNGLPTERLIERLKKVKSKEMERAKFIKLCLDTLKEITPKFINDWKDLGMSCDFDVKYSTIDKFSQKISQESFIDLYNNNLAYKKNFPTLWCPECQTSIAQAELEDREFSSKFSTIKFKTEDKDLLISTTRPELLGACVCIFINPKDKRYKHLVGKKAKVPLFDYEVPIFEDDSAQIEKGTGVLMVCSYGDKYDADAISRKKLKSKVIINPNGTLNIAPYKGMKIKEAREKILEDLTKANLIIEQKDIRHIVNTHDKCGTEIEFIETEQWFIKILENKNKFLELGKKINWYPAYMRKRYENWIEGLDWDWNISRDRHFGIPIPVWECKDCNKIIIPNKNELPIDPLKQDKKCPNCGKKATPENKVLDTWATSSLTPEITSKLTNQKIKVPFSLRPQAHDIIRTWAFYTIVKSFYHNEEIPWKDVAVSGFVTLKGEKMAKSKGNVIDPKEVIEKYGADNLRYWAAGSKLGEDLDYQEEDLISGKKFITKLTNATKFVFMNLKDYDISKPSELEEIDKIFLIELNRTIEETTKAFLEYDYSKAKLLIDKFFWKDFADNYLEIVKKRIYNETKDKKKSAQYTLYHTLFSIIKIYAPIMPFITEELYQEYFSSNEKKESIHICSWPKKLQYGKTKEDISFSDFTELLSKIRQEKTNLKKSMNSEINLTLKKETIENLGKTINDLKDVTNSKEIKTGEFKVEFI
jgi:valyl-tRNA synthetase